MYSRILFLAFIFQIMLYMPCMGQGVLITSVQVGNNQDLSSFIDIPIGASDAPELNYNQNYIIFNFQKNALDKDQSVYYKLEGLDYNWIECQNCEQVQYAHLDGGDYSFLIKSDVNDASIAEFAFRIEGNLWHQWWFIPLLLLFVLGISGIGFYFLALYKMRQGMRAQLLVHKEKLSAMVDLTTGVAHEIQNPLNFVNNFAQLSSELLVEAKEELENNDLEEVRELLSYLKENLEKISNHGGRASNIIREMQEHSKPISTEKSLTDINKFCQDHLQVAYSSFTESDDSISVELKVHLDDIPKKINIAQDEMKRVLLNILSNAFYACTERSSTVASTPLTSTPLSDQSDYKPMVSITTQRINDSTIITITDNGIGMSQSTMDKVFQPFFTTKPTGQGTGLGMSISYDIITKGHGGELKVESVEGQGTTFILKLPAGNVT